MELILDHLLVTMNQDKFFVQQKVHNQKQQAHGTVQQNHEPCRLLCLMIKGTLFFQRDKAGNLAVNVCQLDIAGNAFFRSSLDQYIILSLKTRQVVLEVIIFFVRNIIEQADVELQQIAYAQCLGLVKKTADYQSAPLRAFVLGRQDRPGYYHHQTFGKR